MSVDSVVAHGRHQAAGGGSTPTSTLQKYQWWVREVSIEIARELVTRYHYARGASNTRTYLHGLFPRGAIWERDCIGVAWWIPPTRSAAEATYPQNWQGVLSLSRLVMVPDAPRNACSYLLRHSVRQIDRALWPCLVTYADDWRGHPGTIYKAAGWRYKGKTTEEPTYTIDGVLTARKAGGKTRTHGEMMSLGAKLEGRYAKHKFVLIDGVTGNPSKDAGLGVDEGDEGAQHE